MNAGVAKTWIGSDLKRHEDFRLLTGQGQYVDDMSLPHQWHLAILRSPHAHAHIRRIDSRAALALPGVEAVVDGDVAQRRCRPFGVAGKVRYYPMAIDRVRFVGEPVAVVAARDRYVAEDALDLIEVDYEPLPPVMDMERALDQETPILHDDIGSNAAHHRVIDYGDYAGVATTAAHRVQGRYRFSRYTCMPLETYAVMARYEPAENVLTIWSNHQGPFLLHSNVARVLKLPENRLRCIGPRDIGGGFGIKVSMYPYLALIGLVAMETGLTVKWIEDRREHLLASSCSPDRTAYLEAAVAENGELLGMSMRNIDNVGGYMRTPEPGCFYRALGNYVGPYAFQNLHADQTAVMTNTSLTGPNRGFGNQQLYFGMERLMDQIARRLEIDPAELRRRNFIPAEAMPYTTPTGGVYDSGDYAAVLDRSLSLFGYEEARQRQEEARRDGRAVGVGIACAVDPGVGNMGWIMLAWPPEERAQPGFNQKAIAAEVASVRIDPLGSVTVVLATAPQGQGHETISAQIVAQELGLHPNEIYVRTEFDSFSRVWTTTSGTYSSRFAAVGASAVAQAARQVRDKIKLIAALELDVPSEDLELADGHVRSRSKPDKAISISHVAAFCHWSTHLLPEGVEPALHATCVYNMPTVNFPDEHDRMDTSCTHGFIAEVCGIEVDLQTGTLSITRYVSVHDMGTILNSRIVEGQVLGGIVHGLGGALYEEMAYGEDGQYLAATMSDYLCPTAMEIPPITMDYLSFPSPFSLLGAKGCGEGSAITVPVAVANAVEDALTPYNVEVNEIPLTPSKVYGWLQAANR